MFYPREISKFFFVLASTIICFVFTILLLAAVVFFLGGALSVYILYAAGFIAIAFCAFSSYYYFGKIKGPWIAWCVGMLFISSLFASGFISRQFFDISYDGQTYHQEAIFQLAQGWNPFYRQLTSEETNRLEKWVNHYPKGAEIYEAVVFKFTNNIEDTKLFQIMLMLAALLFALSLLLTIRHLAWWQAAVLALLIAANPVSVYQSLSLYIDGQLASLLAALCCVLIISFFSKQKYPLVVLFMLISIFVNIKSSAIPYAVVALGAYIVVLFLAEKVQDIIRAGSVIIIALIVGIAVIGFNPYITNTVYQGHPLYPVMGKDAIDYRPHNMPEDFLDNNGLETLFMSAFARSDNKRGAGEYASFKLPFAADTEEVAAFSWNGPIEGGWGPLFGGALIVSAAVLLAALVIRGKTVNAGTLVAGIALITLSAAINPISSLARYTPQFYFAAVLCAVFALLQKHRIFQFLGHILILILCTNVLLIGSHYIRYNAQVTREWKEKLSALAAGSQAGQPVPLHFDLMRSSSIYRLHRYQINFQEVRELPHEQCNNPQRIFSNSVIVRCNNEI